MSGRTDLSPLTGEHTDRWTPMHSGDKLFLLEKPRWFTTPVLSVREMEQQ